MTPVEINYYTDVRCQRPILLRNCCTQLNHYICLMSARKCQRNIIPLCPAVTVRCSFLCLCLKYPKNIYYIKLVTLELRLYFVRRTIPLRLRNFIICLIPLNIPVLYFQSLFLILARCLEYCASITVGLINPFCAIFDKDR